MAALFFSGVNLLFIRERHADGEVVPCPCPDFALARQKARRHARLFCAARVHHARDQKLTLLHARAGQDSFLPIQRADLGDKARLCRDDVRRLALVYPLGCTHALAHLYIGLAATHVDRHPAEVLELRQNAVADILRAERVDKRSAVDAVLAQGMQNRLSRDGLVARDLKIPDEKRVDEQQRRTQNAAGEQRVASAQAREEKRRARRALDRYLRPAALGGTAQRAQVAACHAERQRRIVDPPDVPEFDAPRGAEVQHPLGVRALCAHAYAAAQQLDGFFQHSSLISHIPRRRSCRRCAPRCRSCCAASNSARARAG